MSNISESSSSLYDYLTNFKLSSLDNGSSKKEKKTQVDYLSIEGKDIPRFTNEFWTAKQRQASSIHEISYRACFKAQLPRFFINLLTKRGETVYDPFSGRGTTVIEAGLLGRNIISNDINPLSEILAYPRFFVSSIEIIEKRLNEIEIDYTLGAEIDLSMFYHKKTEAEIVSLKNYLNEKKHDGTEDNIDKWIRMVATNRLSGHSKGFFSVYTLPPNQAVSPERQKKINKQRKQVPKYKDVKQLILKKTKSLLRTVTVDEKISLIKAGKNAKFLSSDARYTPSIKNDEVSLIVTSPPFLDVVQYSKDNWLRCWFNDIDVKEIEKKITVIRELDKWKKVMKEAFQEFYRIIKPNGFMAFEVGEIRKGKIKLDETVLPIGLETGFKPIGVIINMQKFTKTANIWGIENNEVGTNTNRIVLFKKK